jgi:hypothetical protein
MYTHFKIPYLQLENYTLNVDTVKLIPEEMARSFQVVALERWGNVLTVGMVNPEDEKSKRILEARIKCKVMPFKVNLHEWANAVNNNYVKLVEDGK